VADSGAYSEYKFPKQTIRFCQYCRLCDPCAYSQCTQIWKKVAGDIFQGF